MKMAIFNNLSAADAYKVSYWEWIRSSFIEMLIRLNHVDILEVTIKGILLLPFRIIAFPIMPFIKATYIREWSKRKKFEYHDKELGTRQSYLRYMTIYMRDVDDFNSSPDEWTKHTKITQLNTGKSA